MTRASHDRLLTCSIPNKTALQRALSRGEVGDNLLFLQLELIGLEEPTYAALARAVRHCYGRRRRHGELKRHIAILAIANRLGANQALGDMFERLARAQRMSG